MNFNFGAAANLMNLKAEQVKIGGEAQIYKTQQGVPQTSVT